MLSKAREGRNWGLFLLQSCVYKANRKKGTRSREMQSWDYNFFYQGGLATKTKTRKDNHAVSGLKKQLPKLIHGGKKKKKAVAAFANIFTLLVRNCASSQQKGGWIGPVLNKPSWLWLAPFSRVSKDRATTYHKEALGH